MYWAIHGVSFLIQFLSLFICIQAIDKLEEMLDGGMTRSKFATNEYIGIYT